MWSITWILIIMSFWAFAQENCLSDDDCVNQFCKTPPGACVDYTICSEYNRTEAAKPSREVSECGGCLEGYYEPPPESTKKADGCMKKVDSTAESKNKQETFSPYVMTSIFVVFLVVILCLYVVHAMSRCNWNIPFLNGPTHEGETTATQMVQNGISAESASSALPYKSQKISIGNGDEPEENYSFSSIQKYSTYFTVNENRVGHALPFHPPFYVRIDPNYQPDDRLDPSGIVNEPTIPSSASSGGTIQVQDLAALTEEEQDSMRNSSLQRPGSPSPSTNQENHGNGENNDDYLEGFSYNNTNGSRNDNEDSVVVLQV